MENLLGVGLGVPLWLNDTGLATPIRYRPEARLREIR
jgi:hypothetical protein